MSGTYLQKKMGKIKFVKKFILNINPFILGLNTLKKFRKKKFQELIKEYLKLQKEKKKMFVIEKLEKL